MGEYAEDALNYFLEKNYGFREDGKRYYSKYNKRKKKLMATNYYNIRGFIKWAKAYEPDEYLGVKRWITNFYPADALEMEKMKSSGLSLKIGKDEDGEFVRLRRPVKKEIKDDIVVFAPPKITGLVNVSYVDQDGNPITSHNKGDGKEIHMRGEKVTLGNLTEGVINYSVYSTQKGNGHRWEGFRVTKLVEFNSEESIDPPEEEETKVEVKEEAPKKAKVTKTEGAVILSEPEKSLAEDMNDELPW